MSAANRVYRNDDIFRGIVRHSFKSSLVSLMRSEQQGTVFDYCVKELYKEVDYEVVKDMLRNTPRRCQYLDAVLHVKSDLPALSTPESMIRFERPALPNHEEPCHPRAIATLRLKCPNIRLVTRHENGRSGQRFTIILQKNKHTGTVRFHEQLDLVPERLHGQVRPPTIVIPTQWYGWIVKHTVGLGVFGMGFPRETRDVDIKAILQDADHLDHRVTELQTGWLPFTLVELSAICTARGSGKNPISRISATIELFTIDHLRQFLMMSGASLYQLHLYTQPRPSLVTPHDLPAIVHLIRTQCPKLVHLRLPISIALGGVNFADGDIDHPPYSITPGPGKVRHLTLLLYKMGKRDGKSLGTLFSWNFARNMACLLSPDFKLHIVKGPETGAEMGSYDQAGSTSYGWHDWYRYLKTAIRFFQSLGPTLESHVATPTLTHLGIPTIQHLRYLRYDTSGKPIRLVPNPSWSHDAKRTWVAFYNSRDLDEQAVLRKRNASGDTFDTFEQRKRGRFDADDAWNNDADDYPEVNSCQQA